MNKTLQIDEIPMEIGGRINEDLLYKGMTCPSRLGFLKKTPIRKGLGLQGKDVSPRLL